MSSLALTLTCECLSAFWAFVCVVVVVDHDARWFGARCGLLCLCLGVCVCVIHGIHYVRPHPHPLLCVCVTSHLAG